MGGPRHTNNLSGSSRGVQKVDDDAPHSSVLLVASGFMPDTQECTSVSSGFRIGTRLLTKTVQQRRTRFGC